MSGCSAGAVGAMSQLGAVKNYINNDDIRITGLGYSGYFPGKNVTDFDGSKGFIDVWNQGMNLWTDNRKVNSEIFQDCFDHEDDPNNCVASDALLNYQKLPFFSIEESYDAYALWVAHGDKPLKLTGLKYAKQYETWAEDAIQTLPSRNGYFMTSCVGHCWASNYHMEDIHIDGQSLADAWSSWYNDKQSVRVIEQCDKQWPPCNEWYSKGQCQWPQNRKASYIQ